MNTTTAFTIPDYIHVETLREDAFLTLRDERAALSTSELLPILRDPPVFVSTVLQKSPRICQLRDELLKLPDFPIAHLDNLNTAAYALSYAHSIWTCTLEDPNGLAALNTQATEIRDQLYYDVRALSRRGIIDPRRLGGYQGVVGYKNVANDILFLTALLKDDFNKIEGRCACTRAELQSAEQLALYILRHAGVREEECSKVEAAADDRVRAYTLVVKYYESARRGINYLRWYQGDADTYAPSLYAGIKHRTEPEAEEEPVTPEPTPVQPSATRTATPAATTPTPAATTPADPNPEDLPGGSPFLQ